jgi:hypothetical protein
VRRAGRVLLAIVVLAAVLYGLEAVVVRLAIRDVSARSLAHSIGGLNPCRRLGVHHWRCDRLDAGQSEQAEYDVTTDGRCWRARRIGRRPVLAEGGLGRRADGCVGLLDVLRIEDRA